MASFADSASYLMDRLRLPRLAVPEIDTLADLPADEVAALPRTHTHAAKIINSRQVADAARESLPGYQDDLC